MKSDYKNVNQLFQEFSQKMLKFQDGEITEYMGQRIIISEFPSSKSLKEILHLFKDKTRINFLNSNFSDIEMTNLQNLGEQSNKTYSWFLLVRPVFEYQENIDRLFKNSGFSVKTEVSAKNEDYIIESWANVYHRTTLAPYPDDYKVQDSISLQKRIHEGINYVIMKDDVPISHLSFKEVNHPVLKFKCNYWHQWMDSEKLTLNERKQIHGYLFNQLDKTGLPAMSGVSVRNAKGLNHALNNFSYPVLFCIRLI